MFDVEEGRRRSKEMPGSGSPPRASVRKSMRPVGRNTMINAFDNLTQSLEDQKTIARTEQRTKVAQSYLKELEHHFHIQSVEWSNTHDRIAEQAQKLEEVARYS